MSKSPIQNEKNFLYCPTHSSEHGELNILCLNPNCPQKGLICYLCVFCEPHINACSSYLTPLRLIQHDKTTSTNPQDELSQKVETHLQGIDNLKQKLIKTINEYETKIRDTLTSFQTKKKSKDQEEDLLEKFVTKNFKNEEEFKSCTTDLINSVTRVNDNDNIQWVYNQNLSRTNETESNTISYLAVQKKLVEKMEDSLLLLVSEIVTTMTSEASHYNLKHQKGKRAEQKHSTGLENILEVSTESRQQEGSMSELREREANNELNRSKLSPSEGGYQPIESRSENKSFSSNVPSNRQSESSERNYTTEMLRDNEEREGEKVKKAGYRRVEEDEEADGHEREERKQESSQYEEHFIERGSEIEGGDYEQLVEEKPREFKYEKTELPNLKQSGRSSEENMMRNNVKEEVNRSKNGREGGDEEDDGGEEEEKESLVHHNQSVPASVEKKKGVMEIVRNKELASSSMIRVSSSKSSLLVRNPNLKITGGRFENIECENYIYVLKRPEKRFDAVALYSREKGILLEGFGFYCPKPVEGKEVRLEYRIYEGVHEDAKLVLSETVQVTEHGEPEGKCEIARIFLKSSVPLQENKYYTLVLKYLDEVKLMYGDGKWLNVGPFVFAGITRKIVKHWLELKYKLAESEMMHSGQFPYLIYSKAEEKKTKA